MKYEFFEHTADAKFRAYGKYLEEAFGNAVTAVASVFCDIEKLHKETEMQVSVKAKKLETLLYDFLEEILFYVDTEQLLCYKAKKIEIQKEDDAYSLNAELIADKLVGKEIHGDVKAITYNEMQIKKTDDDWYVQVVVDT